MIKTKIIMGMPIIVEILDPSNEEIFEEVFSYFENVDEKFSVFKENSEITLINKGKIKEKEYSSEMKEIFNLSDKTKKETNGYFDIITPTGKLNPSGIVKGWAINNVANLLKKEGYKNFYINAGGDIQTAGKNNNKKWKVGLQNPFNPKEIVKKVNLSGEGMATSGTYVRGEHIYNPKTKTPAKSEIISVSIIGTNVYEADRFATAVFAMGEAGIQFVEEQKSLEGYFINKKGIATMTSGFERYVD